MENHQYVDTATLYRANYSLIAVLLS